MIVTTEGTDVLADSKKVVRKCRPMSSKGRPQGDAYDKGVWKILGEVEGVLGVGEGALEICTSHLR